jgi:hypothetical protein
MPRVESKEALVADLIVIGYDDEDTAEKPRRRFSAWRGTWSFNRKLWR